MNKKSKKYLSLFLALTLLLGCFSFSFTAFGSSVSVNAANFPDPVFRQIILDKYGTELSDDEIKNTSVLSLSGLVNEGQTIKTLKGIEFFADGLSVLRCGYLEIEELDVSALYNLTSLTCMANSFTSLDVSNNPKLITLNCSDNKYLTSLTLGNLTSIETLHCYSDSLASIDVSQLPNLIDFRCDQNELTSLDVTGNTLLQYFTCSMNHLTSLDLSNNTSLGGVLSHEIGDQSVSAAAKMNGVEIVIPLAITNSQNITSTSLDDGDFFGYSLGEFLAYDVNDFKDGIDYTYSVSLANSEDMTVHVDVTRDFYQVDFYTDETMQEFIGRSFVAENGKASIPTVNAPLCKALDRWSEDVTNVTSDMEVYAVWKDSHSYSLTAFANGIGTITCANCADSYTAVFMDCVNSHTGDSNYCEYLDVVSDGWINAKDYAQLEKMF